MCDSCSTLIPSAIIPGCCVQPFYSIPLQNPGKTFLTLRNMKKPTSQSIHNNSGTCEKPIPQYISNSSFLTEHFSKCCKVATLRHVAGRCSECQAVPCMLNSACFCFPAAGQTGLLLEMLLSPPGILGSWLGCSNLSPSLSYPGKPSVQTCCISLPLLSFGSSLFLCAVLPQLPDQSLLRSSL